MQQIKFFRVIFTNEETPEKHNPPATARELAVPGTFLYSKLDPETAGDTEKVRSVWFGTDSEGFARLVEIAMVSANEFQRMINRLAHYLVEHNYAPDLGTGFELAQEEADHTRKLADRELGTVMVIDRQMNKWGVSEAFKTVPRK